VTAEGGTGAAPEVGTERRLKLFLIASVALNLLIVGAIAGSMVMWRLHGPGHRGHRGDDFGLVGFSRTLPAERRNVIRKKIKEERANLEPLRQAMQEAHREAAEALGAEPFDGSRLKAAMDRFSDAEMKLKAAGLAFLIGTADELTPEERRALSEWWKKRREFRFRSEDGRRREKPKPDEGKAEESP
jgi:uncharacterized membrane protein